MHCSTTLLKAKTYAMISVASKAGPTYQLLTLSCYSSQ